MRYKGIFAAGLVISTILLIALAANVFFLKKSQAVTLKSKTSLISSPRAEQIYQQQDGKAVIDIELVNAASCTLDGQALSELKNVEVQSGRHSLYCQTQSEEDQHDFLVGNIFAVLGQSNAVGAAVNKELEPPASEFSVVYDPHQRIFRRPGFNKENHKNGTEIGGSLWPAFVNAFYEKTQVPVGLLSLTKVSPIDSYLAGKEYPKSDFYYPFLIAELEKYNKIQGIIWYHGESATANQTAAEKYGDNLRKFIQYVRKDLGYEIPFYLINIKAEKDNIENSELTKIVQSAIENVASAEAQVSVVGQAEKYSQNCDEVESTDCIHLGQKGLNQLGEDVANELSKQKDD
jgi:hypothetical protein